MIFSKKTQNFCRIFCYNLHRIFCQGFCFLILIFFAFACADKKKDYDHTKAVSAFAIVDELKIDESLQNIEIKIPAQNSTNNFLNPSLQIENFAFTPLQNSKKFLNKTRQVWSGYRPALADRFVFAPIIKDGKIYLLDANGILAAYDLASKEQIWESRLFERNLIKLYQNPRIGISGDKIFAIAGSNKIVAANAIDGKILWSKNILSLPTSAPIADEKLVYINTNDNKTYALDINNGKLLWVFSGINKPTAIFGSATPLIYKNMLIVCYSSGEIYSLNRTTGEASWSQDLNINKAGDSDFYLNDIDATPIIKNDVIYSIGNGGLMMAINAKNGNYLWKKEIDGITDFWLAGEFLFAINNDDKLFALERNKGLVKWATQLPNFKNAKDLESKILYSGVVLAGDKLLVADSRGALLVVSPFDGKIEQTYKINQKIYHAPIVIDGKIYLHALGRYTVNLLEIW
jgi:outer membrane protein assembly factor BamB